MNVSLSTRNLWELIFSPTICDVKRATPHNIYLYHHAVCNSKLTSLIRTTDTFLCVTGLIYFKTRSMDTVYLRAVHDRISYR